MTLNMLKGKIHRATVTQAALDYVGSIWILFSWSMSMCRLQMWKMAIDLRHM